MISCKMVVQFYDDLLISAGKLGGQIVMVEEKT